MSNTPVIYSAGTESNNEGLKSESRLLSLPPEIRTLIFRHLFHDVGINLGLRHRIFLLQREQKSHHQQGVLFPHPVCFVNGQMYHESIKIFYEEATIHHSSTYPVKLAPSLMSKLCKLDLEFPYLQPGLGGYGVEFPQILGCANSRTLERTVLPSFPNLKSLRAVVSVPLEPDFESRRQSSICFLTGLVHFRKSFDLILEIRFPSYFQTEVRVVSSQTESDGKLVFHKGTASHPVWRKYGHKIFGVGTEACPILILACLSAAEKGDYVIPWEDASQLRYDECDRIRRLISAEMQSSFVEGWTKNWEWCDGRFQRPVRQLPTT